MKTFNIFYPGTVMKWTPDRKTLLERFGVDDAEAKVRLTYHSLAFSSFSFHFFFLFSTWGTSSKTALPSLIRYWNLSIFIAA